MFGVPRKSFQQSRVKPVLQIRKKQSCNFRKQTGRKFCKQRKWPKKKCASSLQSEAKWSPSFNSTLRLEKINTDQKTSSWLRQEIRDIQDHALNKDTGKIIIRDFYRLKIWRKLEWWLQKSLLTQHLCASISHVYLYYILLQVIYYYYFIVHTHP